MLLTEIFMKIVQSEMIIGILCQKRFKNPVKHLRWSFCENSYVINYFHKRPILDVWQASENVFQFDQLQPKGLSN